MLALIGLGNPGSEYKKNRHNVGFMFIDQLSGDNFSLQHKDDIDIFKGSIKNEPVLLLKPQTYMNNSGIPVSKILSFYKIKTDDVFVFYDDIDVKFGVIKYKIGGSDGGHNGIRSLNANIGKNYYKIRIGVDRPEHKDVAGYVLSNFNSNEMKELPFLFDDIINSIENIVLNRIVFNA